jgi:menaquinone-9 beta-reductase
MDSVPHLRSAAPARGNGDRADVLVVGAGPAGAISALLLARQGHDVLLLDRDAFPRPKPCGDCLSAGATDLLARMGLLDRILAAGPAHLDGWRIVAPGGRTSVGRFRGATALAMERAVLDAHLLRAAREEGVRFLHGRVEALVREDGRGRVRGVRGRTPDGSPFRCDARLVIAADGLRSTVARRLRLVRRRPRLMKVSLTAHIELPALDQRFGEMHVLDGGCIGFAPVGHGRFNLTLVVARDRARNLRDLGPRDFLLQWLARAPGLHGRIGSPDPHRILASGPFDWPVRSATAAGAALVGDAAGYYDPFTGQGMYRGMAGAELLAAAVGPHLQDGGTRSLDRALRAYARRHRRLARPAERLQRLIEAVLSRPRPADLAIGRLARAPAVMDHLVAVTGDLLPARSLISPRLVANVLTSSSLETP